MRCDWNLAKTKIEIVLENFQRFAIVILGKTQFGIVLENFR